MFQQMTYIDAYINFTSVTCRVVHAMQKRQSADTDCRPIISASLIYSSASTWRYDVTASTFVGGDAWFFGAV